MLTEARTVSFTKSHRIFGKALKVALETTFPVDTKLAIIGEWDGRNNPEFVHRGPTCLRVYHPAYADGDLADKESGTIEFFPWIDGTAALYHRLSLRFNPREHTWIRLARFGEDAPFGFETLDRPFVNLDFYSNRADGFIPLYVKIKTPTGFVYLVIESQASDERVFVSVKRVSESDVPAVLVAVRS